MYSRDLHSEICFNVIATVVKVLIRLKKKRIKRKKIMNKIAFCLVAGLLLNFDDALRQYR